MIANRDRRFAPAKSGFTLIEMVVVMVLTAILMSAVVGVFRSVLRDSKPTYRSSATQLLRRQLRRDLVNAREYRLAANGIELQGFLMQDPSTNSPTLRAGVVRYFIEPSKQGGLLARWQSDGLNAQHSPLWNGASAVVFRTSYLESSSVEDVVADDAVGGTSLSAGWSQLPPSFDVAIRDAYGSELVSESIVGVR